MRGRQKSRKKHIAAETLEETKAALLELKQHQVAYLNWAGKAEHNSFEVPTVSLHVQERIDPRTIIEAVRKRTIMANRYLFSSTQKRIHHCVRQLSFINTSTTGLIVWLQATASGSLVSRM